MAGAKNLLVHAALAAALFSFAISLPAISNDGCLRTTRSLVFPQNKNCGDLYTYVSHAHEEDLPNGDRVQHGKGRFLGKAQGTVMLPASKQEHIYLFPSYDLIANPQILSTLAPGEIECIAFSATAVIQPIDKMILPMSRLTGLRRLELDAADLTDAQLAPIKNLPNLEYISLVSNSIHGECFKDMACRNKLKMLDLTFNPIKSPTWTYIALCPNINSLHLGQCRITDKDLLQLAKLPKLADLAIGQSFVTAQGLNTIKTMKNLHVLDINACKLSIKDLAVLHGSTVTKLKIGLNDYSPAEVSLLQKELPGIIFDIPKRKQVDSDTNTLFGPLH